MSAGPRGSDPQSWLVDRADHLRRRAGLIDEARANSRTRVMPVWRSKNYVTDDKPPAPVLVSVQDVPWEQSGPPVFLGLLDGEPLLAVDLSNVDDPRAIGFTNRFSDLRKAGLFMPAQQAQLLGYARTMCRWHRTSRHCESCAARLGATDGGFARVCEGCEQKYFPRTDAAVMVLVTRGDACLLARQAAWPRGMYSALAGFLEPGESLEECVHRETFEEVGLRLKSLRYVGSQPWPFPHQLMVGFFAEAEDGTVKLDEEELESARWVKRSELQEGAKRDFFYPPPLSLAHHLIRQFAAG